tara:strand:- start:39 stop:482 length:444 start_codon:yes stop_codon:yes gene_type:complete
MKTKVNYRFLEENDIQPTLDLLLKHYKEVFPDFSPFKDFESSYIESIKFNDAMKIIIIDISNKVEGFLIFLYKKHPIYNREDIIIRDIYLSKNHRNSDIASNCVAFLVNMYIDKNIFVDLQFNDKKADNFWKKNNFVPYQQRYKLKA